MTMRNTPVPLHTDVEPAPQLDVVWQIARPFKREIEALHARPNVAFELSTIPNAAFPLGHQLR